jgi:hypothetical protein
MLTERCPGCSVELPAVAGQTHRYLLSSPSCWAAFGDVLAKEYADPGHFAVHGLAVDAYAVRHPGTRSPQAAQSVAVQLISLRAMLVTGVSRTGETASLRRRAGARTFQWLEPPRSRGLITVADARAARSPAEHARAVERWARCAGAAWHAHHDTIAEWAAATAATQHEGRRRPDG